MPSTLTSLADCKAWLGLTSTTDDVLLGTLIGGVSQAVLTDLGRAAVLPTTYIDTLDGGGASALALRQWPVTRVLTCLVEGQTLTPASLPGQSGWVLEGAAPAPPGAMQRIAYPGGGFPCGWQNVTVTYRAGYEILGEAAVVPSTPPFVVAALAPYGAWQVDTGVAGASAAYVAAGGTYTFTSADAGASVALSYGYVPADLTRAALEWVADRYAGRTRIGQSAKTLGGQRDCELPGQGDARLRRSFAAPLSPRGVAAWIPIPYSWRCAPRPRRCASSFSPRSRPISRATSCRSAPAR